MKKHFIIIVGIVVIIVIGLFLYFFDPIKKYVVYQKALLGLSGNEAVLVLDNGQEERMFRGEVVDGMTVADVLGAASLAGNFDCRLNSGIEGFTLVAGRRGEIGDADSGAVPKGIDGITGVIVRMVIRHNDPVGLSRCEDSLFHLL